MAGSSYWQRIGESRTPRRRLFGVALALTAGGAAIGIVGCRDGRESASRKSSKGLLSTPEETTAQARAGGTLKSVLASDLTTFDVLSTQSFTTQIQIGGHTYPRLMKFVSAKYPEHAKGDVEGDLAESFELSPDKLQLTFRLRQGLRWEQKPPTSGRLIDAQDVVFSWSKFARVSPFRNDILYQRDQAPGSPVESVTAPDPRTVLVKLKQPDASILGLFAFDRLFYVMPRESEGGFDPKSEVRGYGPWLLAENAPSAFRVWQKNPDYYLKGRPFPARLDLPILHDYATRLAQFKVGNVWTSVAVQEDIVPTKRDVPATLLRQPEAYSAVPSSLAFGYGDGDTPWKDERMRQAVSLLLDRETMIDVLGKRERFARDGLDVAPRYHAVVGAGWEGYWIDPLDEGRFGPNSRYYKYDPAEAKKLMSAAGYADGVDTLLHYSGGNQYGPVYARTAEVVSGLLTTGGVRARQDPREQNEWLPNYHYGYTGAANVGRPIRGFTGIIYRVVASYPTVATQLFSTLHKDGNRFEGMTPDGKNAHLGDPEINRAIERMRSEFDVRKQQELAQDFARLMAKKAYMIPNRPFATLDFTLTWPVIGNLGVHLGWPGGSPVTETSIHWWVDDSKPPLGKA